MRLAAPLVPAKSHARLKASTKENSGITTRPPSNIHTTCPFGRYLLTWSSVISTRPSHFKASRLPSAIDSGLRLGACSTGDRMAPTAPVDSASRKEHRTVIARSLSSPRSAVQAAAAQRHPIRRTRPARCAEEVQPVGQSDSALADALQPWRARCRRGQGECSGGLRGQDRRSGVQGRPAHVELNLLNKCLACAL